MQVGLTKNIARALFLWWRKCQCPQPVNGCWRVHSIVSLHQKVAYKRSNQRRKRQSNKTWNTAQQNTT